MGSFGGFYIRLTFSKSSCVETSRKGFEYGGTEVSMSSLPSASDVKSGDRRLYGIIWWIL